LISTFGTTRSAATAATTAQSGSELSPKAVTFGAHDVVTSTRFAEPLTGGISGSELVVFDHLSHGALHEDPEAFNRATLEFLLRHSG
jgi:pimeloyl-ACP methyl ester carboxylesterase